jgi:hypothetical protein
LTVIFILFLALLTSSERDQGLNRSVTEAGTLATLLTSEKNQTFGIEKYENEMRDRAGEEVCVNIVNTIMLHD